MTNQNNKRNATQLIVRMLFAVLLFSSSTSAVLFQDTDTRITFDDHESPSTDADKKAIFQFFNAMLKADNQELTSSLSFSDQLELAPMMKAGFKDQMDSVTMLMLKTGSSPDGDACVMAIFELGLDYQVQLWFFEEEDRKYTFTAAETPPNLVDQLSGNWVTSYFELKKKQAEIALQPDEESSYSLAGESTSTDGSLGGDNNSPSGPGPGQPGPPGR